MEQDVRWRQRFASYEKAFNQLKSAVEENKDTSSALIKEGIIHRFEFTHELSWKLIKDYLLYEGIAGIMGSRSAVREAFNKGLICQLKLCVFLP